MQDSLHMLIADDNPDDRALVVRELVREFAALTTVEARDEESLSRALADNRFDVVVTDYQLNWTDGLTVLRRVKAHWPDCPVVMFTATEEIAVEAMKLGLDDYVLKSPHHLVRLRGVVRAAVDRAALQRRQRDAEALVHLQSAALQAAANAIVITDRAGTIQWVNRAFTQLTGYSDTEAPAAEIRQASAGVLPARLGHRAVRPDLARRIH